MLEVKLYNSYKSEVAYHSNDVSDQRFFFLCSMLQKSLLEIHIQLIMFEKGPQIPTAALHFGFKTSVKDCIKNHGNPVLQRHH